jgi:hypothetical protein
MNLSPPTLLRAKERHNRKAPSAYGDRSDERPSQSATLEAKIGVAEVEMPNRDYSTFFDLVKSSSKGTCSNPQSGTFARRSPTIPQGVIHGA